MTNKYAQIQRLLHKHLNVTDIHDLPYSLQGFVHACQMFIEDLLNQRKKMQHSLELLSNELEDKDNQIKAYDKKIESMLLDSLPSHLIDRLLNGENPVADALPNVHVVVIQLSKFKRVTERVGASSLVQFLNTLFHQFDAIISHHHMQKVKINGPSYVCISRDSSTIEADAIHAVHASYALFDHCSKQLTGQFDNIMFKAGIHTGPVTLGVMGHRMLHYDIWGSVVDIANQLVDGGPNNSVHVTRTFYDLLTNDYQSLFDHYESTHLINSKRISSYQLNLNDQREAMLKQRHPWHDFLQLRHYL